MSDKNPIRLCTMPKIFGFRDWFESQYGDLCEVHDASYEKGKCLTCADFKFLSGMIKQDWKTKKINLLFSIPSSPVIFVLFTGFKLIKKVGIL